MGTISIVALAGCLALAGCGSLGGGSSLGGAMRDCDTQSYLAHWGCIKGRIAEGKAGNLNSQPDLTMRYTATGDALAERVRNQQMTDIEAKRLLTEEYARSVGEAQRRQPPPSPSMTCRRVGETVVCD